MIELFLQATSLSHRPEVSVWLFGAFLIISQGAILVLGVTLQRFAFRDSQKPGASQAPIYTQRKWLLGTLLYITAQPLNAAGLTLCPFSLAGPLSCGTIMFGSAVSAQYFGETYTYEDKVGLIVGLIGALGTMSFGPHITDLQKELRLSRELLTFWRHDGTWFIVPAFAALLLICLFLTFKQHRSPRCTPVGMRRPRIYLRRLRQAFGDICVARPWFRAGAHQRVHCALVLGADNWVVLVVFGFKGFRGGQQQVFPLGRDDASGSGVVYLGHRRFPGVLPYASCASRHLRVFRQSLHDLGSAHVGTSRDHT